MLPVVPRFLVFLVAMLPWVHLSLAESPFSFLDVLGLPSDCVSFLLSLPKNTELTACVPVSSVAALADGSKLPPVDTVDRTVRAVCKAPACSSELLTQLQTGIRTNCAALLKEDSADPVDEKTRVFRNALKGIQAYPELRKVACIQAPNGGYCIPESYASVYPALQNQTKISTEFLKTFLKKDTCTECNKKISVALIEADKAHPGVLVNTSTVETAKRAVVTACGPEFIGESAETNTENAAAVTSTASGWHVGFVGSLLAMVVWMTTIV